MIGLTIAAIIVSLAVLVASIAFLVRAAALVLPPAADFFGDIERIRRWKAQRDQPEGRSAPQAGSMPETPFDSPRGPEAPLRQWGVAPAPSRDDSPTDAYVPPVDAGDRDWSVDGTPVEERPIAPGSKMAQPPPGPPLVGEEL